MKMLTNILYDMVYHSTPLILAVLGGLFAYQANVLNIGLEGMMLMGAFASSLFVLFTGSLWLGILLSIFCTVLLGLVFSLFSVTLKSNFIITGFGINLFVSSLSSFVLKYMRMANVNVSSIVDVSSLKIQIPIIKNIPILNSLLSGHTPITYLSLFLVVVVNIVLFRTKLGVYTRVVGENEEAAKSVGIKSGAIKYVAIIIGAVFCALAGANLATERMALYTNDMIAGRGFIAIAAIYCGRAVPLKVTMYAFLFGLAKSLAINLGLAAGPISGLFEVVPYLTIVMVLAAVSVAAKKNTRLRGFGHG